MPSLGLRASVVRLILAAVWALCIARPAAAQDDLPPELVPWVPWVLDKHPDAGCVSTPGQAPCIWAGDVAVSVDDRGGSFRMRVWLERSAAVPLPGGAGQWPVDVRSDRGAATVRDDDGRPRLMLPSGGHVVSGRFRWEAMPQSLVLPPETGQVTLDVNGTLVDRPRVDAQGRLQLDTSGSSRDDEGDALEIDVTRHIIDGVPVRVRTRLALRVAGGARELDLGPILLEGTRPVAIEGELPVRIGDAQRTVAVQVRPGTWEVAIDAVHDGPVHTLTAPPSTADAWPATEFWSIATDDTVRSVTIQGGAGIDPARTPIPTHLHAHPAYMVQPADQLTFEEMRRGVPSPPPNTLTVERTFWVDSDGDGITVRDHLRGSMEQGWRANVVAPLELGHVQVGGTDQVITTNANGTGIEVRDNTLGIVAESRLPGPWTAIPAVGWDVDAEALSARIHIPPGWTLLTATGADDAHGTSLARWSLLDVFFILVATGILGRVFGVRTGILALAALVLSRADSGSPALLWLAVAGSAALDTWLARRKATTPRTRTAARVLRVGLSALLLLQLADYTASDLPRTLFPQLGLDGAPAFGTNNAGWAGNADYSEVADLRNVGSLMSDDGEYGYRAQSRDKAVQKVGGKGKKQALYQTLQIDPTAVVQTGPGIPTWSGESARLEWSGRVAPDHTVRLWLLPPLLTRLVILIKFVLVMLLAVRVAGLDTLWKDRLRGWWTRGVPWMAGLLVAGGLWSPPAQAAPSPELLSELEARLTQAPACAPHCVSVSRARIEVTDTTRPPTVTLKAEVHAVVSSGWAIPGPHTSWQPTSVKLDGNDTYALRRGSDGFLYARVPAGVHTVTVEGRLSDSDGLTLQFVEPPHSVRFDGDGFRLGGVRRDGTVDDTLQITRITEDGSGPRTRGSDNLSPQVSVRRSLDLGVPWRVTTEVTRTGPLGAPLSLEVPLLDGEAVTDAGREVRDGRALVSFDGTERTTSWTGTLAISERLRLVAPSDVPWTEEWVLACSPIFSCTPVGSDGLAPVQHVADNKWQPIWRPWPGEHLDIEITRPESIPGQTVTIDKVQLHTWPNAREAHSLLELHIRTSQGGPHRMGLPADAVVRSLSVDGREMPTRTDSGVLDIPLQPGAHDVEVEWTTPVGTGLVDRTPSIDLGAPAVNVQLTIDHSQTNGGWRVPLATIGPRYGPKVLHWVWMAALVGLAMVLGRLIDPPRSKAPFGVGAWVVLLLGLSTLPVEAVAIVVAWTVAMVVRSRKPPASVVLHNLFQLGLLASIPVVGAILLWAVVSGFDDAPNLWVTRGRYDTDYSWALDRSVAELPRATVVSLPSWAWQGLVLAWSLWLVVAVAARFPWMVQALGHNGWFRRSQKSPPDDSTPPPTPDTPPSPKGPQRSPRLSPEAFGGGRSADLHAPDHSRADLRRTDLGRVGTGTPAFGDPAAAPGEEHTPHHAAPLHDSTHDETVLAHRPFLGGSEREDGTEEIVADPDSWAPDDTSSFIDRSLVDLPQHPFSGGTASVSLLDRAARKRPVLPAVELPYNPDRHVEIGPPDSDDSIFIPAVDADPDDYANATAPPGSRGSDDE